jgi:glycosyltransferase involved in cell wall biosynthesis
LENIDTIEKLKEIRIAIIEPVGGHGGMNYYDYGLSLGLASNNVVVYFFTSNATEIIKADRVFTIHTFSSVWDQKNKLVKTFIYFKGLFQALKICKQKKIQVLHFHVFHMDWLFFFSVKFSQLFKFKIVVTAHDVTSFAGSTVPAYLQKKLIYSVDKIIVHNTFSLSEIKSFYPKRDYDLIPHGNYIPFVKTVNPQIKRTPFRILFFGQIKKIKGLDILLEALYLLKQRHVNCELTIAGKLWRSTFDEYQNIIDRKELVSSIKSHIRYIPDDEVWSFFNDTNLVVLPYRKIYQSGVLLMAMSYGRVVLASDLPAFTEIIQHNYNGYLFPNGDPVSLANAIEEIINSNNVDNVERAAYKTVSEIYDWNKIGLQTKNLYLNLINSSSHFHTRYIYENKQISHDDKVKSV